MKPSKHILTIIFFLILYQQYEGIAQVGVTKNGVSLWAKINKFYSQNQKFYIKTINQSYSIGTHYFGQTYICKSENDSILYKINMHLFDECCYDQHFLSDDGSIFSFITHNCSSDLKRCNRLMIFKKGFLKSEISLDSLLKIQEAEGKYLFFNKTELRKDSNHTRNISDCFGDKNINSNFRRDYFYNENEDSLLVFADKFPTFYYKDTLYLISSDLQLYYIDVRNNKTGKLNFKNKYKYLKSKAKPVFTESIEYEGIADDDELPDQIQLIDTISNLLGLSFELKPKDDFYYKEIPIQGFLYRDSIFHFYYKNKKLFKKLDSSIIRLITNYKFSTELIPEYTERRYFTSTLFFRNKNDSIARQELINFERNKERRIKPDPNDEDLSDSIDEVYIPKDLYEAMNILDKTVSDKMKEQIKSYVYDDNDYESFEKAPRLSLNSWPLKSRIAHYLDSFGIIHFESKYPFLNRVFAYYLKDSAVYLKVYDYHNFKEDSNLFFYMYYSLNANIINFSNINIIKPDSNGKNTFYYPFEQSEFVTYKYDYPNAEINNFRYELFDNSSHDFLDSLTEFLKIKSFLFKGGYTLDSLVFIKDPSSTEIEDFLKSFKEFISKDNKQNELKVEKYNIYYTVGKSEIDSIDNIFCDYNKIALEENYYDDINKWGNFYNSVMKDFFNKKLSLDLYVIRLYPIVKFDFKEYKKKKKKK